MLSGGARLSGDMAVSPAQAVSLSVIARNSPCRYTAGSHPPLTPIGIGE